jgi:flavin reductase (DIM6/NTAB) family NADH-FMN oxidoreductase RutF
MLGFGARSHTPANIQRTGECVLNLPSVKQVAAVNVLARIPESLYRPKRAPAVATMAPTRMRERAGAST